MKYNKTYKYDKGTISFSISYPGDFLGIKPPILSRNQVFAATDGVYQNIQAHVSRIPKNMRLEDATKL